MRSFLQPTAAPPSEAMPYYRQDEYEESTKDSFTQDDMSYVEDRDGYRDSRFTDQMDQYPRETYEYSEYTAARSRR
jgi:hypothetical protein